MYLVIVVARVWLGRGTAVVAFSSATASTMPSCTIKNSDGHSALYLLVWYNCIVVFR